MPQFLHATIMVGSMVPGAGSSALVSTAVADAGLP